MKLSIVIPIYNEAENIEELINDIKSSVISITTDYEILVVDDGSNDNSLSILKKIKNKIKELKIIILSKNFGHQNALFAGLKNAKGDIIITMDGDFQHPPSYFNELIKEHEKGFEIVNTIRKKESGIGNFKKFTSKLFYKLFNLSTKTKINNSSSDFRLISRKALDEFLKLTEKNRFNRGLFSWIGFNQTTININSPKRNKGKSKYNILKMSILAIDGITSFSSFPLRISFILGLIFAFFGFLYSIYAIIQYFYGNTVTGWTSLLITVLILSGVQLISLGIIGEYISKIYSEVKNRPPYIIQEIIE